MNRACSTTTGISDLPRDMVQLATAFLLLLLAHAQPAWAELRVHFIDVDQGDAILLQAPEGSILVDAGPANGAALDYLREQGIARLDLIVASHAHADHIGGFTGIVPAFHVDTVWYNGQTHTTVTFERFIDAVLNSEARYHEPVQGETIAFGDLAIEVLHPAGSAADYDGHLHDHNIVIRAAYGDIAFMLTGDAEEPVEAELIEAGLDLRSNVLKLGHHGSRTSTSPAFVAAVGPEVAVYQAGRDNQYGHPHAGTLKTLSAAGVTVYGTDTHGTIIITTDGRTFSVATERDPVAVDPEIVCVDLNTASEDDLQEIVHIGAGRAADIVARRPWRSVRSLTRIAGVGPARLADIKEQALACVEAQ